MAQTIAPGKASEPFRQRGPDQPWNLYPRPRPVAFDLAPQALDVDIEGLGVAHIVAAPDAVDDLASGYDVSRVAQQQLKQFELAQRQPHLLPIDVHLVALHIDTHPVRLDDADGECQVLTPPQDGTDPCHQLAMGERLSHIIVGADLKPHNLVRLGITRGDHDDRDVAASTQLTAHLGSRHAGKHQVQQHQVGPVALILSDASLPVGFRDYVETLLAEHKGECLTVGLLVLDDQDPGHPSSLRISSPMGPSK